MIYVRFMGGLGNQMFQYAIYRMIAEFTDDVKIDLSHFEKYKAHNGYELDSIFNIKGNYSEIDDIKNGSSPVRVGI